MTPTTALDNMNKELISEITKRKLDSELFTIKTKAIHNLEKQVKSWISSGACGAIIYGRTRVGKTRAVSEVCNYLKKYYGSTFPAFIWYMTDHTTTEKYFYSSLLSALHVEEPKKNTTALVLKNRVLNELVYLGNQTPFKRVVIFIDEAWLMDEKDFSWLMDLYNVLNDTRYGIQLICFLFGTPELLDRKAALIAANKRQIVERFMIKEMEFKGLAAADEVGFCLLSLDHECMWNITETKTDISLKEFYFPEAKDTDSFFNLTDAFCNSFIEIKEKYHLGITAMPMSYFIKTIIVCFNEYGILSDNPVRFPKQKEIYDCMLKSGLTETGED